MNFFKSFLASCLGTLVALIALVVLSIMFLAGLTSDEQVVVKENSVLHLKLDAPIAEMQPDDAFGGFPFSGNIQPVGLVQLKQAIANAKAICGEHFGAIYELEIVDLLLYPKRALADKIIVTPTLLRLFPLPVMRVIGNLSDTHQVLLALAEK